MQHLSDYVDNQREAAVYYSSKKARYYVITNCTAPREFYTESEADDWAEDFVLGELEWQKQTQNFQ